jgi:hypothetical protein
LRCGSWAVERLVVVVVATSLVYKGISRDPAEQAPATPFVHRKLVVSKPSESCNDIQGLYAIAWDPNKTKYQPQICDVLAAPSSVLSNRQQDIARLNHPEIHKTVASTRRSADVTTLRRRAPVV